MIEIDTIVGILQRDNKVLVTSRPLGKSYSGYWEFPGGKREYNETSFSTLQRELKEELGIETVKAHFCFAHSHEYPEKKVNLEVWEVMEYKGEPDSLENQELKWLPWEEVTQLQLLPANFALINRFKLTKL